MSIATRTVRAPRGTELHCLAWPQEAAFRMIQNNLDPDVAEKPDELIVYGATGRAARSWRAFDRILETLRRLRSDETLLVQSGKPVGVFRTHEWAPRVLIANALIVPRWATWDEFRRLEDAGLTMYGQMTAGSWIYIGTQGILQGTYETFAAVARKHFGGSLTGRVVVSAGLGGMGGAQPLAVTMNEGVALIVEVETDQTSAHDPLDGYVPAGIADPAELRRRDPEEYIRRARASIARHCEAIVQLQRHGAVAVDYGNNLRGEAKEAGFADAFSYPGFVPEYIRPLFAEGRGPFRWVALSGEPADIRRTDRLVRELFPHDETLVRWIRLAEERVPFQGLPARVCWLGYGERAEFGEAIDDLVRGGEIGAPIVIGRDHLDSGSVASPFRETEGMRDGSGNSLHAGMVAVADGTTLGREKLRRVLTTDPGTGVMRHADAGYPEAITFARERGIDLPSGGDR